MRRFTKRGDDVSIGAIVGIVVGIIGFLMLVFLIILRMDLANNCTP